MCTFGITQWGVLGLDVGDTHILDLGSGEADFVVTGVTSSARNMGQNVTISSDGYRRSWWW